MARRKRVAAKPVEVEEKEVEEAEEKEEAASSSNVIVNTSNNKRCLNHIMLAVGESCTLTDEDLKNELLMKKIERAVEIGVLSRG